VAAGLELADATHDVPDARDQGENTSEGDGDVEEIEVEGLAEELDGAVVEIAGEDEDQGDRDHLEGGRGFAHPAWFYLDFADEVMEQGGADEDDGIASDDEDGEPEGKFVGPIAEAEGDDGGEEEAFVGDGVEDDAETAALVVVAGDVAIDAVAGGGDEEYEDGDNALPILRMAGLPAASVIDGHHHEDRD